MQHLHKQNDQQHRSTAGDTDICKIENGKVDNPKIDIVDYISSVNPVNQISNAAAAKPGNPDSAAGYGYFFWRCSRDNAYSGRGWGGQYIFMLPDQDACITITSHEFNTQAICDCVWDHIVPQLKAN